MHRETPARLQTKATPRLAQFKKNKRARRTGRIEREKTKPKIKKKEIPPRPPLPPVHRLYRLRTERGDILYQYVTAHISSFPLRHPTQRKSQLLSVAGGRARKGARGGAANRCAAFRSARQ